MARQRRSPDPARNVGREEIESACSSLCESAAQRGMSAKIDERAAEIVAEKVKEAEKGFAQRQQTRDKLLGDHCRAAWLHKRG